MSDGNGVSAARNTGIRISQGKYIAFIDDDDTISEKYLDTLYNDAIENRVQVVLSNYEEIYQGQKFKKSLGNYGKFNNRWIREKFLPQTIFSLNGENLIWLPVWRTLIQKDIIIDNNIKFNENISQAEDFIFMLRVLINTKNIFLDSGSPVYFYNRRSNSAMNKYIHNDLKKQLYFHSVFIYTGRRTGSCWLWRLPARRGEPTPQALRTTSVESSSFTSVPGLGAVCVSASRRMCGR